MTYLANGLFTGDENYIYSFKVLNETESVSC